MWMSQNCGRRTDSPHFCRLPTRDESLLAQTVRHPVWFPRVRAKLDEMAPRTVWLCVAIWRSVPTKENSFNVQDQRVILDDLSTIFQSIGRESGRDCGAHYSRCSRRGARSCSYLCKP